MQKIIVIYHRADFDGLFCREIAMKFLGDKAEYIGWDHGDAPVPFLPFAQYYILDLPVDRVFGLQFKEGWICRGDEQVQPVDRWDSGNIFWIDHHASAIASHPTSIPGYRIDGVAACRLAWQWFSQEGWHPHRAVPLPTLAEYGAPIKNEVGQVIGRQNCTVSEPYAVRLAGEYDIWDHEPSNQMDIVFQFGLRRQPPGAIDWSLLLASDHTAPLYINRLLNDGLPIYDYQRDQDKSIVERLTFMVEFEGLKFLALNTARFNSLTFAAKDVPETGHDALLGFYFVGGKGWSFSLYHARHRTDIDLSKIAAAYGGGGHRGACGFRATQCSISAAGQLKIIL